MIHKFSCRGEIFYSRKDNNQVKKLNKSSTWWTGENCKMWNSHTDGDNGNIHYLECGNGLRGIYIC